MRDQLEDNLPFSMSIVAIPCEVCGKQSNFSCSNCQSANYCSKEHQKQHWKNGHKTSCLKQEQKSIAKKETLSKEIIQARKNYYENYSNKIFNHCLLDARLMTGLSKQLLELEPSNIKFRLEYGSSICLLSRTYKLLNDDSKAKHQMEMYLKASRDFLYDKEKYKEILDPKTKLKDEEKQEFQMKLNLISGIANICYVIGLNATQYYVLYTQYVIFCFGEDSFQASNCYFLIGTYFSEQGSLNKAIACFQKAAKIRGQFAGDCMFNIGVLNKMMGNLPKALENLQTSMKLREEQYGQDSNEVAEVNQLMGNIYAELNDYKTALRQYEKAYRVRCSNPLSPEYQNIVDLIHQLYQKLCLYIKMGQPNMKRLDIYDHLKQEIRGQSAYWQNQKYQKDKEDDQGPQTSKEEKIQKFKKKKVVEAEEEQKFSWKQSGYFNISDNFISTLNLSQLFRLSELQLQLQTCQSIFSLAYIVGTSLFFESLRPQKKVQLESQNDKLFQLMRMEDIKKIKHKDK